MNLKMGEEHIDGVWVCKQKVMGSRDLQAVRGRQRWRQEVDCTISDLGRDSQIGFSHGARLCRHLKLGVMQVTCYGFLIIFFLAI